MKSIIKTAIIAIVSIIGGQAAFASPIIVVKGKAAVWNIPNSLTTSSPALQAYPATSTDCTGIRSTITQTANGYLYSVKIEAFENAPTNCDAVHFSYKSEGNAIRHRFTTAVRAISPPNASVSGAGASSGASGASSPVSAQGAQIGSDEDEMPACGAHIIANGKACKWTKELTQYGIIETWFKGKFAIRAAPVNADVQVSNLSFELIKTSTGNGDGKYDLQGTTITGTITAQKDAAVGEVNIALINSSNKSLCAGNGIYHPVEGCDRQYWVQVPVYATPIDTITIVKAPPKGKIAFVPSQLVAQTDTDEQGQVLRLLVYLDAPLMQAYIGDTTKPISVQVNAVASNSGLLLDGASNKTTMTFTSAKHYGVVMVIVPANVQADFGDVRLSIDPASTAFYQADPVDVEIVDPTEAAPAIPPCAEVDGTGATGDCVIDEHRLSSVAVSQTSKYWDGGYHRLLVTPSAVIRTGFTTRIEFHCHATAGTKCEAITPQAGAPDWVKQQLQFKANCGTGLDALGDNESVNGGESAVATGTTPVDHYRHRRCEARANNPFSLRITTTRKINPAD